MRKVIFSLFLATVVCWSAAAQVSIDDSIDVAADQSDGVFATGALPVDRDLYEALPATPVYRDFLPLSADLSARFPTPASQGKMGSCVAWAVGYAARSYYAFAVEHRRRNIAESIASPAYIYHSIRTGDCASGSYTRDAFELLKKGSVSLATMPYSDKSCVQISASLRQLAVDFQIESYNRVDFQRPDQIKAQLAAGDPVVFSIGHTPKSFHYAKAGRTYKWDGPEEDSSGHAMVVVGYDDRKQAFRIMNSWGRKWGDGGFLWVDYETFSRLADEAYVMTPRAIPTPDPRPDPPIIDELDLSRLRCSQIKQGTKDGKITLTGFVGYASDLEKLRKVTANKAVNLDVELRPWPQCEVLLTLDGMLSRPDAPHVAISGGQTAFSGGDVLPIAVETAGHPTYLYISYIQADGSVVNLHQPTGLVSKPLPAYRQLVFGDGKEGAPLFRVTAPYGRELVVAVASKSPLFGEPLPRFQTEREYLSAMRKALVARPDGGGETDRVISATVASFITKEKP